MTQYCRYCSWLVTGNGTYCYRRNVELSDQYAKNPNHCKLFDLNPMDAFFENERGYIPRKPKCKDGEQIRITI